MELSMDFCKEVLEEVMRRGVKEALVRAQERVYEVVVFDKGVLRTVGRTRLVGLGIKVVLNGAVGYAYTSSSDPESIGRAIDMAIAAARSLATRARPRAFSLEGAGSGKYRTRYLVDPLSINVEDKIELVRDLNKLSLDLVGLVSAVTRLGAERDRKVVVSSFGAEVEVEVTAVGLSHLAVAKSGDVMERVSDQKTFAGGYEFVRAYDWEAFVREVSELAVKASQARAPPPGVYRAVVDNELVGLLLHEAFGHASEGDHVLHGTSVLSGKVGTPVASELVTIVDEGLVEGGYPLPFDDEGAPKGRTVVLDRGILKGYLHSRSTAGEMGSSPTGNARAQDVTFDTLVRQTNFYMLPGDARVEELFEGLSDGIYLRGRGASGGEVDPSLGTFTFSVGPSYLVRRGEPAELVRGVIVSGSILETLKGVDMVARDLKVTTSVFGGCGKEGQLVRVGDGGPHIRVQRIVVGGI